MGFFFHVFLILLPWSIRRRLLNKFLGYEIHPKAKIGFSYIYPKKLIMEEGATIGHLNVAVHIEKVVIKKNSTIARGNWITGFPTDTDSRHFSHDRQRKSELIIGMESAITKKHHIDCTNSIVIGNYVTIAGYDSQFLTHSIDIYRGRQDSHAIIIGDYSFVSTGVRILGGSILPAYSVLGAGAVLNKAYKEEYKLYAGVPAKPIKELPNNAEYFNRANGYIY